MISVYQGLVVIDTKQWQVSIATSYQEITEGLGGLEAISANTGMLFDPGQNEFVGITTYPMLFPIDIAFISDGLLITQIERNVPPGTLINSEMPARFWLEVNGGELSDAEVGDSVSIELLAAPILQPSYLAYVIPIVAIGVVGAIGMGLIRAFSPKLLPEGLGTQTARVVTVPGGSRWRCETCGRELKPGEKAVKVGSKVYCNTCARAEAASAYYTDTETSIERSGLMFQTQLDDAFVNAIRRAKEQDISRWQGYS